MPRPKGYHHTPETKAKITAALLKRGPRGPMTAEMRAKLSAAHKGRPKSVAHRAALSKALKASAAFQAASAKNRERAHAALRGFKMSAETKAKMSVAHAGKAVTWGAKISAAHKGKSKSIEHRLNNGAAMRASPKAAAQRARLYLANPSSIELAVQMVLRALSVDFLPQHRIGRYAVDLWIPSRSLIIECDGSYWHRNRQEHDQRRDEHMRQLGYATLRLTESAIRSGQAEQTLKGVFLSSA